MLDNYTFLDGLHSHNLLIMWFFSPCRIFEDVNIQNNNLPPKNCLITRWTCTSTPFPSLKKKTQNLWIRFVGFPSKLDVSRKLRVEVRKRETFSRGMWKKKKKSPFVSDFTWTSFCRVEDDRKKKTCSIFEWRRTITLLSHTHDRVPVVFPLPWIRYEHASDGLEGRPALDPALLLLCLNYSFPAPKQLRCEKANLRDLNKNWLHH